MDKNEELRIIEEMQAVAAQMKQDDIDENPDSANDYFDCDCCGKTMPLAGSIAYGNVRLCNDCVLLAETGFALGKLKNIDDLLTAMEDKKLENLCEFIKQDEQRSKN